MSMHPIGLTYCSKQRGSALICALATIVVLSIIGAGVLMNCTTRYNVTSKQVKAWKEALYAAESGADLAYDAIRKYNEDINANGGTDPGTGFPSASGWASPAPSPLPTTNTWSLGYGTTPFTFGTNSNLTAKVTVDRFGGSDNAPYYRIRSTGTAQVFGLKRTGMDNRLSDKSKGDNLLRKVDFNFDHFTAAFGFGDAKENDAATAANGKGQVAVSNSTKAQVTRRIELVAIPVMPIEAGIKTQNYFTGTTVDSYDSQYGPYAGPTPPTSPFTENAQDGDVACGGSTFTAGKVYGDVSTNGGNATSNNVTGVIDNSVPFVLPAATPGVPPIPSLDPSDLPAPSITWEGGAVPTTINPAPTPSNTGTLKTTYWYKGNGNTIDGITVNPAKVNNTGNTPVETTVNLYATSNGGILGHGLTVNKGAIANVYIRGNVSCKAKDFDNNNVDGPVAKWDWFFINAAARTAARGFVSSDVDKLAYQDNPAGYWRVSAVDTTTGAATWLSYTLPNSTWPYSNLNNVVCRFVAPRWVYSNAAARTSASGLTVDDIGGFAFQSDTKVYWRLTGVSPLSWDSNSLPYEASSKVSRADHNWFYGISPTDGSIKSFDIEPPGTMYAAFYMPDYEFGTNGNPDIYGVMVCNSFTQNGNCTFHFDKQLATSGTPLDYRISSFVEDVR
jgi:Tfp pilus assembly protein PilX